MIDISDLPVPGQVDISDLPIPPQPSRPGFAANVGRGAANVLSQQLTGAQSLFDANKAAEKAAERQKAISETFGEQPGFEAVKKKYRENGLLPAVGEYIKQIPGAMEEQAPQIAESSAAARLAAAGVSAVGLPEAAPVAALAGMLGSSFMQQYGGDIERQAEEQRKAGKPVDINRARAAFAGVIQAPLDVAERFIPMGKSMVGSIFGKDVANLVYKGATKEAEELAAKKIAKEGFFATALKGTAKGVAGESIPELVQQAAERAQAGLSLTDEDAQNEYGNTLYQVSQLGTLGALGRFSEKGAAKNLLAQPKTTPPPPVTTPITPPIVPSATPPAAPPEAPTAIPPAAPPVAPPTEPPIEETPPPPTDTTPPADITPPNVPPVQTFTPETPKNRLGDYHLGLPEGSDAVFQNRDRNTKASIAQMNGIAANPDYNRLRTSYAFGSGAPVVIADEQVPESHLGHFSSATAENGQVIPVHYAVVEANQLTPSHSADGTVNANYAKMEAPAFRPVAGNGRVAGIQAAYERGNATDYKEKLLQDDDHGIDKSTIEGMKEPVLVRIMPKSHVTKDIGDISNITGTARLSTIDNAKNDANRIDLSGLDFKDDGTPTDKSLREFVEAMPVSEHGDLKHPTTGDPTPHAQDRLLNAIFYKAYNSEPLVNLHASTIDPEAKSYLTALAKAAPEMSKLEGAGEYDLRPQVMQAAEMAVNAKRQGLAHKDMINLAKQQSIGQDPVVAKIFQHFVDAGPRPTKSLSEYLKRLGTIAREQHEAGEDMFGPVPKLSVDEVINKAKQGEEPEDLFNKPEEPKDEFFKEKPIPEAEIYSYLNGATPVEVAEFLFHKAPNSFYKGIAEKVFKRVSEFDKRNVNMTFTFKRIKDAYGQVVFGYTENKLGQAVGLPVSFAVEINPPVDPKNLKDYYTYKGHKVLYGSGTNFRTLLHEMIHLVTTADYRITGNDNPHVKALNDLLKTVKKEFKKHQKQGLFTNDPELERLIENATGKPQEFITYGLTEDKFQKYLSSIKVGEKTAFGKLVEYIRRVLDLSPEYESALDRVVRLSENMLDMPALQSAQEMEARGHLLGDTTKIQAPPGTPKSLTTPEKVLERVVKDQSKSKVLNSEIDKLIANLPKPKDGFTRVYRGEYTGPQRKIPDWIKVTQEESGHANAQGRWWTTDPEVAKWYMEDAGEHGGIVYQDVPSNVVDAAQVTKADLSIKKFSREPEKELFLPKEYVGKGRRLVDERRITEIDQQATGNPVEDAISAMAKLKRVEPTPKEEESYKQRVQSSWNNFVDNPGAFYNNAIKSFTKAADYVETKVFNSGAAFQNSYRRLVNEMNSSIPDRKKAMLGASLAQPVSSDAVANVGLEMGKLVYDPSLFKWKGEHDDSNFINLFKQRDEIARQYNVDPGKINFIARAVFEARRTEELMRYNADLENRIQAKIQEASFVTHPLEKKKLMAEADALAKKKKTTHMEGPEVGTYLGFLQTMPELNRMIETWQGIRKNIIDTMVEGGLYSEEDAELLLDSAAYVPFYREDMIEKDMGPKSFIPGLQVAADKKFKGSVLPVNDIFDNMMRWAHYGMNRSVRNKAELNLIDGALELNVGRAPADHPLMTRVKEGDKGNIIKVYREGKLEFYDLKDPLYLDTFRGMQTIAVPTIKWMSSVAAILRKSVVLNPLFSLSQVPQDSFAAIFSSGLKTKYALSIPARAVKEFVQSLTNTPTKAHLALKAVGAVGRADYSASTAADNAIFNSMKGPPGFVGRARQMLDKISMASDNAVRQAVYSAAVKSGLSQAEALEKAFEVINFRTRGSNQLLIAVGQTVPFFNAYLAAQHVAIKTISGRGISPQDRQSALNTLLTTTASIMALSLLYTMANASDDDYLKKSATIRDRLLMIPGTGMSIPIRTDIFSIPKILTEHMYLLLTDNGTEDPRKFRDSMAAAAGNSIFGPTPVPQVFKPFVETKLNYDFFQGQPLIGKYQQGLDPSRQFNDSTSELAKILGSTDMVSPINADHIIRGMFGSVGGLTLLLTNHLIAAMEGKPRPDMTVNDMLTSLPGTSGFVSKEFESGYKKDFYVLRDQVDRAAATFADIKNRSPEEIEAFVSKPENITQASMAKSIDKIAKDLTAIRKAINFTQELPESEMSSAQKQKEIENYKRIEEDILKSINIKELRKMAMI